MTRGPTVARRTLRNLPAALLPLPEAVSDLRRKPMA